MKSDVSIALAISYFRHWMTSFPSIALSFKSISYTIVPREIRLELHRFIALKHSLIWEIPGCLDSERKETHDYPHTELNWSRQSRVSPGEEIDTLRRAMPVIQFRLILGSDQTPRTTALRTPRRFQWLGNARCTHYANCKTVPHVQSIASYVSVVNTEWRLKATQAPRLSTAWDSVWDTWTACSKPTRARPRKARTQYPSAAGTALR